jgi:uncharacterized protein YndB with AHSA1/START domain
VGKYLVDLRLGVARDPNTLAGTRGGAKKRRSAGRLSSRPKGQWLDGRMSAVPKVVIASREIAAPSEVIFELIADPSQQPRWDGNDNLGEADPGQRIRCVGHVFTMVLAQGSVRENHVVEFEEGHRIAWLPAEVGAKPPGHLWRWEVQSLGAALSKVTHTYDWSQLTDESRFERARSTTSDRLRLSLDRLAKVAESPPR